MAAPGSTPQQKAALRAFYRDQRQQISAEQALEASRAVCKRLQAADFFTKCHHIGGYVSFRNEIDIHPFLDVKRAQGCSTYLPRVGEYGRLEFVAVDDSSELVTGAFGILEPTGQPAPIEQIELFLVPALAFDLSGQRLGFGKGYYDRILHSENSSHRPIAVGIAYHWQLAEVALPFEQHDAPMDVIATDTELIYCSARLAPLNQE
ncbi:MAG: 5-formyltetrahydrofolate cyclo-ligase [Bradymonadaceae bacterium]|nr:5-formyltetrahydrofolate cyclo-ligase [Lujinxingiaceae bacterium]